MINYFLATLVSFQIAQTGVHNPDLDFWLDNALCNQNWAQAIAIVNNIIRRNENMSATERSQLLSYRQKLQGILARGVRLTSNPECPQSDPFVDMLASRLNDLFGSQHPNLAPFIRSNPDVIRAVGAALCERITSSTEIGNILPGALSDLEVDRMVFVAKEILNKDPSYCAALNQ